MHLFKYPLLLFPCFFVFLIQGQTIVERSDVPESCQSKLGEKKVAYPGWPFTLNCDGLVQHDVLANSLHQCFVSSLDMPPQLANRSLVIADGSGSVTSYNVSLVINETSCYSKQVTVELRRLSKQSPSLGIVDDVTHDINVDDFEQEFHSSMTLHCVPPPTAGSDFQPRLALPASTTTTWWRTQRFKNGSLNLSTSVNYTEYIYGYSHIARTDKNGDQPDSIRVHSANFLYPAVYSCQVTNGNESAFVVHHSVCILTPVNSNKPITVGCNQKVSFVEKEPVMIQCNVQTSTIQIKSGQMEVEWRKKEQDSTLCRNVFNESLPESNPQYTCSINNFPNPERKCFEYIPSDRESNEFTDKKTFSIQLNIKDIAQSDAGNYTVRLRYEEQWSEKQEITLEFNQENQLKRIVLILGIILGILLFIAAGILVVWWYWIPILLCYRRHFGKYDEDEKEFVAILSYVYSQELRDETRERTKKIVKCIQDKMDDMNYKFYDSRKHFDQGSSVENLLKYLNQSHRMIVVLTDAYVDERWTRFEAQMGFHNMLKNRTKLIFIRTPGAKKALNKYSKDDFTKELREAMNASRNIKWSDKMSDSRLKDHVEYALPNLKRHEDESSGKFMRLNDFDRSVSRATEISFTPSSPDYANDFAFHKSAPSDIV